MQSFYQQGAPSADKVRAAGAGNLAQVGGTAAGAGVDPNSQVTSGLAGRVADGQNHASQMVRDGKSSVQAEGQPIEQKAADRAAPGSQALLGIAATNAVAQVLPDGASKFMMDKMVGDLSIGAPGSAVAEAGAARASAGAPRDPVLQTGTQVVGAASQAVGAAGQVADGALSFGQQQAAAIGASGAGTFDGVFNSGAFGSKPAAPVQQGAPSADKVEANQGDMPPPKNR